MALAPAPARAHVAPRKRSNDVAASERVEYRVIHLAHGWIVVGYPDPRIDVEEYARIGQSCDADDRRRILRHPGIDAQHLVDRCDCPSDIVVIGNRPQR